MAHTPGWYFTGPSIYIYMYVLTKGCGRFTQYRAERLVVLRVCHGVAPQVQVPKARCAQVNVLFVMKNDLTIGL